MNIKDYLEHNRLAVDRFLDEVSPPAATPPTTLHESMRYSLMAGGKRVRPILTIAAAEAVGTTPPGLMAVACSLEFIHTYSLIHDDLPSMDNDDFRRGKPTNHKVYGEAMAILAGDALLTDAFALAAQSDAPAEVLVELLRELSYSAGSPGMVGGQVVDVEATGKPVDLALLKGLHAMKTGALFDVSLRGGARLGGAAVDELAAIRSYAQALGLAFQIVDDVLDVTQDLAQLGKDPGSDKEAGKTTYVDLLGVEGAMTQARQVMDEGIAALAPFGAHAEPLRALGNYTVDRKN